MKKLLVLLLLVILGLTACGSQDTLTFVFTPGPGVDLVFMEEQYGQLVKEIGEAVGAETKMIVSTSAAATTEALKNGSADIARFGPFGYIMAAEEVELTPLVRERMVGKGEHYYGLIIGQPGLWEEPFTMSQVVGKTVAFAEPGSTSGYLFAVTMMAQEGIMLTDLGDYSFVGSHPAVIESVLSGAAQVGSTNDRRLNLAIDAGEAIEGENFVYLAESPPIMLNPWVARADLEIDPDIIIGAFMDLSAEAKEPSQLETMVVMLDSDYDFVRSMAENQ